MFDLAELIEMLSLATEGSRELDADIQMADPRTWKMGLRFGSTREPHTWISRHDPHTPIPVPAYTTSIDAALTLVPDGWHAMINWREKLEGSANVVLYEFPEPCRRIPEKHPFVIAARTAALALCIAALRARAALVSRKRDFRKPTQWSENAEQS